MSLSDVVEWSCNRLTWTDSRDPETGERTICGAQAGLSTCDQTIQYMLLVVACNIKNMNFFSEWCSQGPDRRALQVESSEAKQGGSVRKFQFDGVQKEAWESHHSIAPQINKRVVSLITYFVPQPPSHSDPKFAPQSHPRPQLTFISYRHGSYQGKYLQRTSTSSGSSPLDSKPPVRPLEVRVIVPSRGSGDKWHPQARHLVNNWQPRLPAKPLLRYVSNPPPILLAMSAHQLCDGTTGCYGWCEEAPSFPPWNSRPS